MALCRQANRTEPNDKFTEHLLAWSERFPFVPPGAFRFLAAYFESAQQLERVLSESWVPTWAGWSDIVDACSPLHEESVVAQKMVKLLQRFAKCTLANIHLRAKCDSQRKEELLVDGFRVEEGLVFNCNGCLIDSLLQCVASIGLLDPSWAEDSYAARIKR